MNLLSSLLLAAHDHGDESWWQEFLELLVDPAHILFELVFTLVFDVLVIAVGYNILVKKIIIPRLRKEIHREIDEEHGITHNEKETPESDASSS